MRKGCGVFVVMLIPAVILSWLMLIGIETQIIFRFCLENSPVTMKVLAALPFLIPPAIYFFIDRATTKQRADVVIRTGMMAVAVALPLMIGIPSFEGATQRSKQKDTVRRMRAIMDALEANATRTNRYPQANDIASLQRQLGVALPVMDNWCHPFVITSNATGYQIVSYGIDGKPDAEQPYVYGRPYRLEDDIVVKDGSFLRMPEGVPFSP